MTLRLKIYLIVSVLTLLFVAGMLGLQVRNKRDSIHEEVVAANRVATQFLVHTARRQGTQGTATIHALLRDMGRVRSNDIVLFDAQGHELYRSPRSTYKAGKEAPEWFARLVTPPRTQQQVELADGRLTVSANASRAVLDAWDDLRELLFTALGFLVAVNALVFWLVGRATRPLAQIRAALDQMHGGRFDVRLPPLPGVEAAAIGTAFNRMVDQVQSQIETERRAVRAEMQLSDSRELARWVESKVEQERRLIAHELHDEFGQSVTAMRSMALSVAQRVEPLDASSAAAARVVADECSRLYQAMHGIIPRLAPLVLDTLGLADALTDLAERTRTSHAGVRVDLDLALGDDVDLDHETTLALYRSAQEGVANALRHGQPGHLQLALRLTRDEARLTVTDDGRGPPEGITPGRGRYGLRWLAERVERLGGSVTIEPGAAGGMRLALQIPLHAAEVPT